MGGWIKLYRNISSKAIWKCTTPEQKTILITLLLMANHEPNEWEWQGEKYIIQPGQFITSLKNIAEKAGPGISIKNVRTAVEKFEKLNFLANQSTNKNRLITIVNWDVYQAKEEQTASKTASDRQADGKQAATNKNIKNIKNINIGHFDAFWKAYPKKVAKSTANKVFDKLKVDDELLNKILFALEKQKQSRQWQDKQFIPHATTWLNQRRWEDEDDMSLSNEVDMIIDTDGAIQLR